MRIPTYRESTHPGEMLREEPHQVQHFGSKQDAHLKEKTDQTSSLMLSTHQETAFLG